MKKWLCFALTLALLGGLAAPALAESAPEEDGGASTDARLAQVTLKVKETLGVGDGYAEFYGELWENELAPTWSLNWEGEGESLRVETTEAGKVLWYSLSRDEGPDSGGLPSFPAVSRAEAGKRAEAFLRSVLEGPLETAAFDEGSAGSQSTDSHRFTGTVLLNGLPSPFTFSVTVDAGDGTVTRFSRDSMESSCVGGVPGAAPASSSGAAGALLKGTLALRLEYVLEEDGTTASLRYLPEPTDEFYVDAATGELVNLTELYAQIAGEENGMLGGGDGATAESAAGSAAMDAGLTQAEQAGIAQMEGVLSREALDRAARGTEALGLADYALATVSYRLDRESGDVTASLAYTRRDGDAVWQRHVDLDGRTGALLRVSSSAPYDEDRRAAVDEAAARRVAQDFLAGLWGEEYGETALYESMPWTEGGYGAEHTFVFARQANGYFLPCDTLEVLVDVTDGSISGLYRSWTPGVTFADPAGIVDGSAALAAWFDHYDVALAYRQVPVKLDPAVSGAAPLMELGYSYFYGLTLSYALEEEARGLGVDARTGDVVYRAAAESGLAYGDLEGHWVQARAEALAAYGVGWSGDSFRPDEALTQLDLVALLASARGYRYDPAGGSQEADDLYRYAYSAGILARGERNDDARVTRGEVVRRLLNCAGLGEAAALRGIYTCAYADADQIPDRLYGYAALAQGLGVVEGEVFAAGRTATRAEAAAMLCNFMDR